MAREQVVLDRCRADAESCPSHAAQFLRLINAVSAKAGRARLEEANRAVNTAIRYVSDQAQHGEADRWSAPLASLATAKGDCEDYAIAKYVALRAAGVARENLQLVLVRDRAVRQDHAVLAARLDDRWLILDNRQSLLIEDADASSFMPLFAINHDGVHLFAAPYARRALPDDQTAAAPAAAGAAAPFDWTGSETAEQGCLGSRRLAALDVKPGLPGPALPVAVAIDLSAASRLLGCPAGPGSKIAKTTPCKDRNGPLAGPSPLLKYL